MRMTNEAGKSCFVLMQQDIFIDPFFPSAAAARKSGRQTHRHSSNWEIIPLQLELLKITNDEADSQVST